MQDADGLLAEHRLLPQHVNRGVDDPGGELVPADRGLPLLGLHQAKEQVEAVARISECCAGDDEEQEALKGHSVPSA